MLFRVRQRIFESPVIKTAIFVVSSMLAGIFSGALVAELTVESGILWEDFYKAKSFYVLLALTAFIYWYNREAISFERHVLNFKDTEYCLAYVRSKCIPEAADRYRKLIGEGKVDELEQAMLEVERLLR